MIIFRCTLIPQNKNRSITSKNTDKIKYSFETEIIDTGIGISEER